MYTPHKFQETRLDVLHALMAQHPLGTIVSAANDGLCADHIPCEIAAPTAEAPFGRLRAHVARANPLWRKDGHEVLVVFQGPSAYITPSWFEEKRLSGEVVPTYNYAAVHAHGTLRTIEQDPEWLLGLLERMTEHHEAGRAAPWSVHDAPRDYIERLMRAIVGIEIDLSRLEGKWKINQDHPRADHVAIAEGLAANGASAGMAQLMTATLLS